MSYGDQIGRIRNLARSFAFMHSSVDATAREHTAEENCDAEVGQGGDPTAAYASLAAEIEMEPTEYRRLLVREYRAAGGRDAMRRAVKLDDLAAIERQRLRSAHDVRTRLAAIPHDLARVRDTTNRCLLHARTERARSRLRVVLAVCCASFPGERGNLGAGGLPMDDVDARAAAYEAKVLARIERLRARAAAKAAEAERLHRGASAMADQIPMGQPILVGHHSEGRDRRYRERIRDRFLRAFAASEEARSLARRADGAADLRAVSSDDPRACEKLRSRLAEIEEEIASAKRVNALWREGGAAACEKAGIARAVVERAARNLRLMPSWTSPLPTDNLAANARRIRERIAELEARATAPTRAEIVIGDVTISEDRDENRVRVRFPRRPGKEATKVMRRWGFVWSPTASAWQRKSSETAWVAAEMAAKELTR